jgi:hypothetical protein
VAQGALFFGEVCAFAAMADPKISEHVRASILAEMADL